MLKIDHLVSGGIITNYKCTSICRHCCYSCSPKWPDDYMTTAMADEVFSILRSLGCYHVHIGGGEPLLKADKILDVLDAARKNNIEIEYIETNSSWYRDETSTIAILKELKEHGVNTLLISIDPFHNEYIPFWKVKALIAACSKAGINVFPWLMEFWNDIDAMDDKKNHSLDEYKQLFGHDYMLRLLKNYGINIKGRALKTYKPMMKKQPFEQILKESSPCNLLSGTYHFHIDLYGNFIPQSCPGFSIPLRELVNGADPGKYRIFSSLESAGIRGFVELATKEYGYKPKEEYAGRCFLCYDMRNYLVLELGLDLSDLQPANHYKQV